MTGRKTSKYLPDNLKQEMIALARTMPGGNPFELADTYEVSVSTVRNILRSGGLDVLNSKIVIPEEVPANPPPSPAEYARNHATLQNLLTEANEVARRLGLRVTVSPL